MSEKKKVKVKVKEKVEEEEGGRGEGASLAFHMAIGLQRRLRGPKIITAISKH